MAILQVTSFFPSQSVKPRLLGLHSNDTLATVTGAGYLDDYVKTYAFPFYTTDFVAVTASDGNQWYQPQFTGSSIQLVALG